MGNTTEKGGIYLMASVYPRPSERKGSAVKTVANRRVKLLDGEKTNNLFVRPDRDWFRMQFELGREVLLTPDL